MHHRILTFTLAFASLSYEFCLSHAFTILFGQLVEQYIITTGLFIFFLGFGALLYEFKVKQNQKIRLFHIEFLLSFFGAMSVFLPFVFIDIFPFILAKWLSYSLVILIAILSGIELPMLINQSDNKLDTLGSDYLGMCFAGVCFPLFFLPSLGLLNTSLIIALINLLIAFYLVFKEHELKYRKYVYVAVVPICFAVFAPNIQLYIEGVFLGQ